MIYTPPTYLEPRNPYVGVCYWREFLYDVRHPLLWAQRGWNGIKETIRWINAGAP